MDNQIRNVMPTLGVLKFSSEDDLCSMVVLDYFHTRAKCAIWIIIQIAQFELCSVHTREVIAIFELHSVHTRDRIWV